MELRTIFRMTAMLFMTFTVVMCCNPVTMSGVDAAPIPEEPCNRDIDCPEQKFCHFETLYKPKFCSKCQECQSLFNRKPRPEIRCARKETDCGDCLNGFVESHGYCSPVDENGKKTGEAALDRATSPSSSWNWLTLLLGIAFIFIVILTITGILVKLNIIKIKTTPATRGSEDEPEVLERLNNNHNVANQDIVPTAPIEYSPQQPFHYPLDVIVVNETGRNIQSVALRAGPFQPGNGADNWIDEHGDPFHIHQHDVQHVPDADQELIEDVDDEPIDAENEELIPEHPVNEIENVEEQEEPEGDMPMDLWPNELEELLQPLDQAQEDPGQPMHEENMDPEQFDFFFNLDFNLGIFVNNAPQRRPNFNMEETAIDLPALLNQSNENSHHSSQTSMADSRDSGTGTGPEDNNSMDASIFQSAVALVPQMEDEDFADVDFHDENLFAQGEEEEEE